MHEALKPCNTRERRRPAGTLRARHWKSRHYKRVSGRDHTFRYAVKEWSDAAVDTLKFSTDLGSSRHRSHDRFSDFKRRVVLPEAQDSPAMFL